MRKYRVYRHEVTQPQDPSYRLIPLTQSQNAIVDSSDYDWLMQWNWMAAWSPLTESFYVYRKGPIHMARQILACSNQSELADHINHDTLDNRRYNLRKVTPHQNLCNRLTLSNSSSGITGVSFSKRHKQWQCYITNKGRRIHLGWFRSKDDAANKRSEASKKYHGAYSPNSTSCFLG